MNNQATSNHASDAAQAEIDDVNRVNDDGYEETVLRAPKNATLPVVTAEEGSASESEEASAETHKKEKSGQQKQRFFQRFSFGENDFKSGRKKITFGQVIGGDILTNDFFRRQLRFFLLLIGMAIFYISNRYLFQQEMIEIDQLKKELTDIKYDALTRSSELTERSRQSHIQEYISEGGSTLETATQPPYLIK
jgi:hypothetical protein